MSLKITTHKHTMKAKSRKNDALKRAPKLSHLPASNLNFGGLREEKKA